MRELMIKMFGEEAANGFTYREANGQTWVLAKDICNALGTSSTTQTMRFVVPFREKLKFKDNNINQRREVWFINEVAFWKILCRKRGRRPEMFREWMITQIAPGIISSGLNGEAVTVPGFNTV